MDFRARLLRQLAFTFGIMTLVLEPSSIVYARREADGSYSAVFEGIYGCDGLSDEDLTADA